MAESRSQTKRWDAMNEAWGDEKPSNVVLLISPDDEDRSSLERIFNSDCTVIARATVASALSVLRVILIPVVICDCDISSGSWTEILDQVSVIPDAPLFIASSRLADERLWAQALNLGAWDVLAKPFDRDEVIRIAGNAIQHWQDRHGAYFSGAKKAKTAGGTGYFAATGT